MVVVPQAAPAEELSFATEQHFGRTVEVPQIEYVDKVGPSLAGPKALQQWRSWGTDSGKVSLRPWSRRCLECLEASGPIRIQRSGRCGDHWRFFFHPPTKNRDCPGR